MTPEATPTSPWDTGNRGSMATAEYNLERDIRAATRAGCNWEKNGIEVTGNRPGTKG